MRLVHQTYIDQYVDDFYYAKFLKERVLRLSRRPLVLVHDSAPLHEGSWMTEMLEDSYPRLRLFRLPTYAETETRRTIVELE